MSDGVERCTVDDCGSGSSSGEEDFVDEGRRGEIGVLGDEKSDDSSDEGRLERKSGKGSEFSVELEFFGRELGKGDSRPPRFQS